MPYEIKFQNVPVGVSIEASAKGDHSVKVRSIEFASEEDGDILVARLEAVGNQILSMLPRDRQIVPSQVQHLLAVIHPDNSGTVYLNELATVGTMQVKREIVKGEAVGVDDIADVHSMRFEGVTIPPTAGIVYIFSVGWRRAIFYDFTPLLPEHQPREYDLGSVLAQLYSFLLFQNRFKINDQQWQNLFAGQWFPFITLKDVTIRNLLSHAAEGWHLDDLAEAISREVVDALPSLLSRWKAAPTFAGHIPFLEQAAARYKAGDFISTTSIVYPRIEGIMRSFQQQTGPSSPPSQPGLSSSAVQRAAIERHDATPLLPAKFREYLKSVYFASFNPKEPKIKVSRNSIGHGVAAADECSLKSATISLLLVDQLWYCFSGGAAKVNNNPAN